MIVIGIGTTASQAASKRKRQHLSQPTGVIKSLVRHYPGTARQSEGIPESIYDEHTGFSFYISMLWTIFGSPYRSIVLRFAPFACGTPFSAPVSPLC